MKAVATIMVVLLTFRRSVTAWTSGSSWNSFSRGLTRGCGVAVERRCYSQTVVASYSSTVLSMLPESPTKTRLFGRSRDSLKKGFAILNVVSKKPMDEPEAALDFSQGTPIVVEVLSFGPLGASVHVIGLSHNPESILPENEPPLATGLILQKEIQYYRQSRGNVDVVLGEVLPAYVERVRDTEGVVPKLDICLRVVGGRAKTEEASVRILERLEELGGELPIGDMSPPEAIAREFPGMSKNTFKRTVGTLFDQKKVWPSANSIRLYVEADGISKRN